MEAQFHNGRWKMTPTSPFEEQWIESQLPERFSRIYGHSEYGMKETTFFSKDFPGEIGPFVQIQPFTRSVHFNIGDHHGSGTSLTVFPDEKGIWWALNTQTGKKRRLNYLEREMILAIWGHETIKKWETEERENPIDA